MSSRLSQCFYDVNMAHLGVRLVLNEPSLLDCVCVSKRRADVHLILKVDDVYEKYFSK